MAKAKKRKGGLKTKAVLLKSLAEAHKNIGAMWTEIHKLNAEAKGERRMEAVKAAALEMHVILANLMKFAPERRLCHPANIEGNPSAIQVLTGCAPLLAAHSLLAKIEGA